MWQMVEVTLTLTTGLQRLTVDSKVSVLVQRAAFPARGGVLLIPTTDRPETLMHLTRAPWTRSTLFRDHALCVKCCSRMM